MERLDAEEIAELRKMDGAATREPWPLTPDDHVTRNGLLLTHADAAVFVAARNALPRLLDEVERSRALLKRIEWSGEEDGIYACPECRASHQHKPDCELDALIS